MLINDKFDIWKVSPKGGGGMPLTRGGAEQDPPPHPEPQRSFGDPVDLNAAFVSLFAATTKKSGYARLSADGGPATRLIFLDKSVTALAKAEKADVYSYRVMDADDSPDLFVGGADLTSAKQVTSSNAFLSKYAWTHAELVDYVVTRGKQKIPLQGILQYPANYEPGKKYPMVVYLYEKLSDGLHNFQNPSERDYYNGVPDAERLFLLPAGHRVRAARAGRLGRRVRHRRRQQGRLDGRGGRHQVGVMGHSWGGFDAMYLDAHEAVCRGRVRRRHLGSH